jgi:hypothetical protein
VNQYYQCKTNEDFVVIVTEASTEKNIVKYVPILDFDGKGKMPVTRFLDMYTPMTSEQYIIWDRPRPGLFFFETENNTAPNNSDWCFPGVASAQTWNGWAVPYFKKPVIEAIFKHWYLGKDGCFDRKNGATSPITWDEWSQQGYFWESNHEEVIRLERITHEDVYYYGLDGYCWERLRAHDNATMQTLMPWFETNDRPWGRGEFMTDEELVQEFKRVTGYNLSFDSHSILEAAQGVLKNNKFENIQQYIVNWMFRWRSHLDA